MAFALYIFAFIKENRIFAVTGRILITTGRISAVTGHIPQITGRIFKSHQKTGLDDSPNRF
ncbi:hypothetical protein ACSFXN_13820 [Planococcus sp. 1R117A]|uniref:hypothetical protein n=1 Tax=Planococcus sp. 1R117A TaxID=3447020 RepID=UPI003EDB7DCE